MSTRPRHIALLALTALISQPVALEGQYLRSPTFPSLRGSSSNPHVGTGIAPDAPPPQQARRPSSLAAATTLATIGSAAGLLVGAVVGTVSNQDWDGLILGAGVGSFIGAGLGGAAASPRPGMAFLGSAVGLGAGLVVAKVMPETDGFVLVLGYTLTHGLVTGLFGRADE